MHFLDYLGAGDLDVNAIDGVAKSQTRLSDWLNWTELNWGSNQICCCCSVTELCLILCDPIDCSTPGFPVLQYLPEFAGSHAHWVNIDSDAIYPYHPLLPLHLLPSVFPSIRIFWNESAFHIKWTKYWRFSFSISLSNEYSRIICFRIDWFDLLVVQGTLENLLQNRSSKASILWCSAFFMVQLSHLYLTTGKIIVLTIQT